MHTHLSKTTLIALVFAAFTLLLPGIAVASGKLDVYAVKAPVAPDGTTAGAATDIVITFKDPDPNVKGVSLKEGATVEIKLDDAFTNIGEGNNTLILLQGWPQSPPAPGPAFIWTTVVEGNTITATLTGDYKAGQFGPGPKQAHLLLFGFTNPALPGAYTFDVTIDPKGPGKSKKDKSHKPGKSKKTLTGSGTVRIIPDARPSVEPVSFFSGPPGPPPPFYNPIYQTLPLGVPARQLGLYLWAADSAAMVGVDIKATANPTYYQITDDAAVVGEIWITAPAGATDFGLASVPLPPGGPPSVEISAFATNVPVGLLGIQFTPDLWVPGDYEIAISMKGGNEKVLFVTVKK